MLYIVETGFDDKANEAAFNEWYDGVKTDQLLSIPGFNATQRFRACDDGPVPYLAIHSVSGPELFSSAAYTAGGGGTVDRWEEAMKRGGWTRRLFDGVVYMPAVPMTRRLVMIDGGPDTAPRLTAPILWLDGLDWHGATSYDGAKALDSSVPRRGFAVVAPDVADNSLPHTAGVRAFRPITAWRKNA